MTGTETIHQTRKSLVSARGSLGLAIDKLGVPAIPPALEPGAPGLKLMTPTCCGECLAVMHRRVQSTSTGLSESFEGLLEALEKLWLLLPLVNL